MILYGALYRTLFRRVKYQNFGLILGNKSSHNVPEQYAILAKPGKKNISINVKIKKYLLNDTYEINKRENNIKTVKT